MKTFAEELDDIFGPAGQHDYAEARLALEIAVQFAALRERRGLTQRQVADRLGRTQQAVSKIENPSHGGHNLARLKAAVAALDAALDVTVVPLEDLEAYDACRPPKPTLEDIHRRAGSEVRSRLEQQSIARRSRKRISLKPSPRPLPGVASVMGGKKSADFVWPSTWSFSALRDTIGRSKQSRQGH